MGSASDSEDDPTHNNLFTGGEKSSLEVEDPGKKDNSRSLVDEIMRRAAEQIDQPDDRPSARAPGVIDRYFTGFGKKLGNGTEPEGEEGPETIIGSETGQQVPAKVTREITFWKQGFLVGDGPLLRYDDPANAVVLRELNRGRVPMALLDVEFGQDVDVLVFRKVDEDWVQRTRASGGFLGDGNRLGSPVPGEVQESEYPVEVREDRNSVRDVEMDSPISFLDPRYEDMCAIHFKFANGKRVLHKFLGTDPVNTVYDFVRLHPQNESGPTFVLNQVFPIEAVPDSLDITVKEAGLSNSALFQMSS